MIDWPTDLVTFATESWFLQGAAVSGGRGLDGREQVVFRENRYWSASLSMNPLWKDKIPPFLAKIDEIKGRSQVFRLPVCNIYAPKYGTPDSEFYAQLGYTPSQISQGFLTHSDGTPFSDGTGYDLPPNAAATASAGASAGGTSIASGGIASIFPPGTYFSINDFLYRVSSVSGGLVHFNPPLREDVLAGATIESNSPTIQVRMASDNDARLFVDYHRWSRGPSMNVVEVFDR